MQKTSPQSPKKPKSKFYLSLLGLAKSGSEQPSSGATLLGWPTFIYYYTGNRFHVKIHSSKTYCFPSNVLCVIFAFIYN